MRRESGAYAGGRSRAGPHCCPVQSRWYGSRLDFLLCQKWSARNGVRNPGSGTVLPWWEAVAIVCDVKSVGGWVPIIVKKQKMTSLAADRADRGLMLAGRASHRAPSPHSRAGPTLRMCPARSSSNAPAAFHAPQPRTPSAVFARERGGRRGALRRPASGACLLVRRVVVEGAGWCGIAQVECYQRLWMCIGSPALSQRPGPFPPKR